MKKTKADYPCFADIPAEQYHQDARDGKFLSSHLLGDFRKCPLTYHQKMTGVIPPQDYDFLYKAGAACIFGPGTRIPEAAEEMLNKLNERLGYTK